MKTNTNIIGVGGNSVPPNPRLASFILPSLVNQEVSKILIVSSVDAAIKFATSNDEKEVITFNTTQKIDFLICFQENFFQENIVNIDHSDNTNEIEQEQWLLIWDELESRLKGDEKRYVFESLSRFNSSSNLDNAKIYAIRHAFWFLDVSLSSSHDYSGEQLTSVGGLPERFFNFIRVKILDIPEQVLGEVLCDDIFYNDVKKEIYPFKSRVVQYGESTRKSGKKRHSIEYPFDDNAGNIADFYQGSHQKKAGLNDDIGLIHQHIGADDFQDFWSKFSTKYIRDRSNI